MTASSVFPTIVLLALALIACPESPRFLMAHDKYGEAYETLSRLRGSHFLAAKELLYTHFQLRAEHEFSLPRSRRASSHSAPIEAAQHIERSDSHDLVEYRRPNFAQKLGHLFTVPRIRNATITAVVCMFGQQLCGVSTHRYWSVGCRH